MPHIVFTDAQMSIDCLEKAGPYTVFNDSTYEISTRQALKNPHDNTLLIPVDITKNNQVIGGFHLNAALRDNDCIVRLEPLSEPQDKQIAKSVLAALVYKFHQLQLLKTNLELAKEKARWIKTDFSRLSFLPPYPDHGFKDGKKTYIEIGFGNGVFLESLGKNDPNCRLIGFEIHTESYLKATKRLNNAALEDVFLYKLDALTAMDTLFPPQSVDGIFINFPVPWPDNQKQRWVICPHLMDISRRILKKGGFIELATDSPEYAAGSNEILAGEEGLSSVFTPEICHSYDRICQTKYEKKWLSMGRTLHFVRYQLDDLIPSTNWTPQYASSNETVTLKNGVSLFSNLQRHKELIIDGQLRGKIIHWFFSPDLQQLICKLILIHPDRLANRLLINGSIQNQDIEFSFDPYGYGFKDIMALELISNLGNMQ